MFDHSIHPYSVLSDSRRVIAISNIHDNSPVLKKLLHKIAFDPEKDALFLVGDLSEKGPHNLKTLYYITELSRHPHVHPMIGNRDVACRNVLYGTRLEFLQNILLDHPDSTLHKMTQRIDQHIDRETDIAASSRELRKASLRELTFTDRLPHVIETEHLIFAHAGVWGEKIYGHDIRDIMVQDLFMKEAGGFHEYIAVGYLPVNEYRKDIYCPNPTTDTCRHIMFIDGGSEVKPAGQLGVLIYEQSRFQPACSDHLKKVRVTEDILPVNGASFSTAWHKGQIRMLCDEDACCLYRHETSDRVMHIAKEFLFYKGKGLYACDFTNYQISAGCGNLVEIVSRTRNVVLVRR